MVNLIVINQLVLIEYRAASELDFSDDLPLMTNADQDAAQPAKCDAEQHRQNQQRTEAEAIPAAARR